MNNYVSAMNICNDIIPHSKRGKRIISDGLMITLSIEKLLDKGICEKEVREKVFTHFYPDSDLKLLETGGNCQCCGKVLDTASKVEYSRFCGKCSQYC